MDNGKKNIPKVLTTNEIRKHARDWTLAGDAGLLSHLEQFSENLISKTQETQNNLNELVDHYEELYTKVGNITNQFLGLQNCQFVENRVYDEETPTEEHPEVKAKDETEKEKLLLMQYKEAVEVGVKILDTHFLEVQLPPNSDSDEEDENSTGNSIIWRPKNPYTSKKFPLLIGSAEWWADDHVGLRTNEDGLDSEKIISESESEMESLKSIEKTIKSSSSSSVENMKSLPKKLTFLESSSEDLFGFDKNKNQQNASENFSDESSSLVQESANFLPDSERETMNKNEIQPQERPSQAENKLNKVDKAFTRELMAKLVSVTNKNEKTEEKPMRTEAKVDGNLFDETDDSNDLFSSDLSEIQEKVSRKRLFDGDDNVDELLKGKRDLFSENNLFKTTEGEPFGERNKNQSSVPTESPGKQAEVTVRKSLANDLFDDLNNDDMLFAPKTVTTEKTAQKSLPSMGSEEDIFNNSSQQTAVPKSVWGDEEGLFDNTSAEVDDSFFSSAGLFDVKSNTVLESAVATDSKSEDALSEKVRNTETKPVMNSLIFDSKPENTSDDPFGFSSSKEITHKKSIDSEGEDDLFSKISNKGKKPIKIITQADDDDDDDDDSLFAEKPKPIDSTSISSSRSSLFDDTSASKSRLASVFDKDKTNKSGSDLFNETDDSLFGGDGKTGKDLVMKGREEGIASLFDDRDDNDVDDLFGAVKKGDEKKIQEEKIDEDFLEDLFTVTKPRETKSEVVIKSDDIDDDELFSDKFSSFKPKPPNSLNLKAKESEPKAKSVGKLSIPNDLKMKLESAAKHIAPGGSKPSVEDRKEILDETLRGSNLLKCPSKDRVKIPGKRRPQSRRARQEAIRYSGVWDEPTSPSNSENVAQTKDLLPSPLASNPLSPSTDEEDFFKVPELDTNFEKEDQSIFKSDLFESGKNSKLDDNLLPVLSPLSPKNSDSLFVSEKKPASLFDVDNDDLVDEDESLFKASKPPGGDALGKSENKLKKSLFDLDDEEDDLFGGKLQITSKSVDVEKVKESGGYKDKVKEKEKGNLSFVDPLGLMSKDE